MQELDPSHFSIPHHQLREKQQHYAQLQSSWRYIWVGSIMAMLSFYAILTVRDVAQGIHQSWLSFAPLALFMPSYMAGLSYVGHYKAKGHALDLLGKLLASAPSLASKELGITQPLLHKHQRIALRYARFYIPLISLSSSLGIIAMIVLSSGFSALSASQELRAILLICAIYFILAPSANLQLKQSQVAVAILRLEQARLPLLLSTISIYSSNQSHIGWLDDIEKDTRKIIDEVLQEGIFANLQWSADGLELIEIEASNEDC